MSSLSGLQSLLVRSLGAVTSGSGNDAALLVLIFHRVLVNRDPLLATEPDSATFAAQMRFLAQNFNVMHLRDAVDRLNDGRLPRRAACVTFDDGYANNCDVALPILTANKIPATVFVAPAFMNGGRMFNDTIIESLRRAPAELDLRSEQLGVLHLRDAQSRIRAIETVITALKHLEPQQRREAAERIGRMCGSRLPDDLMLTDAQLRKVHRAGIEIGAHTSTHPILTRVDSNTARREIEESRSRLEQIISAPVKSFAYPNGRPGRDYDATHVAIVKQCGFDYAVSTAWGAATSVSDRHQIPRIAPWDASTFRYGLRMALAYRQRAPLQA
jgi:peptidoglycan/xylan/chitin deacetylase (PgdA/CDA1 family)